MGDWPVDSGAAVTTYGAVLSASTGTTVAASATANTKGAWIQLTASTTAQASALMLHAKCSASIQFLFDIGVGPSGSETVLIADIHCSRLGLTGFEVAFPVRVPEGSRIAMRVASATASATVTALLYLISGGFDQPASRGLVRTYGATSGTSGGTSVDAGATANTKGAWTEIVLSTTDAHRGLMVVFGNQGIVTGVSGLFLFDIGVGASGSEQIIAANVHVVATNSKALDPYATPVLPVSIPAGSRIAVRSQSNSVSATGRLLDVLLYGVN